MSSRFKRITQWEEQIALLAAFQSFKHEDLCFNPSILLLRSSNDVHACVQLCEYREDYILVTTWLASLAE